VYDFYREIASTTVCARRMIEELANHVARSRPLKVCVQPRPLSPETPSQLTILPACLIANVPPSLLRQNPEMFAATPVDEFAFVSAVQTQRRIAELAGVPTVAEAGAGRARDKYCPVQPQEHRTACVEEFDNLIDDTRELSKIE